MLVSCDKQKESQGAADDPYSVDLLQKYIYLADTLLPLQSDLPGLTLADSGRTIRPAEAIERLGSQAEELLTYQFVGLSSRVYTAGDGHLYAEIAQFTDSIMAYGYYAQSRPDGTPLIHLGTEGYREGNSTYFTKGEFVVTLSSEGLSESDTSKTNSLANQIADQIEAAEYRPPFFMLFPYASQVHPSTKFYPYRFLGIDGINEVYTTDFLIGGDTTAFFLTMDQSGTKYLALLSYAESVGEPLKNPKGFEFDTGYSVAFEYPGQGIIVAGLIRGKLVGAIGYRPSCEKLATGWVRGLK